MNWNEIYTKNKTFIMVIGGLVIILLGYWGYKKFTAKKTAVPDKGMCLTPEAQRLLADQMKKKMDEINACDCEGSCSIKKKPVMEEDSVPPTKRPQRSTRYDQ